MSVSFVSLWVSMGPFAKAIVLLLVVMSLASCATAVERLLAVRAAEGAVEGLVPEWRRVLAAAIPSDARREAFDRSVRASVLTTQASLRRGFGILATVGATAPFVGLVGTVLGIVNAFAELASADHGGVGQVSAGIAEALVTTAFGIGVAIPAVWAYNYLSQRVGRLLIAIECRAQTLAVEHLRRDA